MALGVLVVRFTAPAPPDPTDPPGLMESGPPPAPSAVGAAGAAGPGVGGGRPIPPGMLQGMLQAARQSLEAGRMNEAIAAYQAILKRDPSNVDALTHFGLILAMSEHPDRAIEYFDRALAVDPDYPEALSYTAQVRYELKQDYTGAIAAWERFARVVQSEAARSEVMARVKEARAKLAQQPPTSGAVAGPAARPAPAQGTPKP